MAVGVVGELKNKATLLTLGNEIDFSQSVRLVFVHLTGILNFTIHRVKIKDQQIR